MESPEIFPTTDREALAHDPEVGINFLSHRPAFSLLGSILEYPRSAIRSLGLIVRPRRSIVLSPIEYRTIEFKVNKFQSFGDIDNKHVLTLSYGDAIHVLNKCRGQIFSKFFQETFVCKVDEGIDSLEVHLWDCHQFTSDKLVGSAKVELQNVTSNFRPFTTELFSDNGRLVGEVELQIRFIEASMQHSIMPLLPSAGLTRPSVLPDGLPGLQGTEIPSARIGARIADLYEFNYGVMLMKFLDRFVCKANDTIKVLAVDLWKRHRIFRDELVGSAKIELDYETFGDFLDITTQLFSKDGRYVGEVGLNVWLSRALLTTL